MITLTSSENKLRNLLRLAYHEAAHYTVCRLVGVKVTEVVIAPAHGHVAHLSSDHDPLIDVAGYVGEVIVFGTSSETPEGMADDLDQLAAKGITGDDLKQLVDQATALLTEHASEWFTAAHDFVDQCKELI